MGWDDFQFHAFGVSALAVLWIMARFVSYCRKLVNYAHRIFAPVKYQTKRNETKRTHRVAQSRTESHRVKCQMSAFVTFAFVILTRLQFAREVIIYRLISNRRVRFASQLVSVCLTISICDYCKV